MKLIHSNCVYRGGGWLSPPQFCRAAHCVNRWPGYRDNDVGFRLAL